MAHAELVEHPRTQPGQARRPEVEMDGGLAIALPLEEPCQLLELDMVEDPGRDVNVGPLAAEEGLDTRFEHGDALRRDEGADVYISTGVLHHIELEKLAGFFERQRDGQAAVHFDFRPSRLAWLGSWVFHQLRMRHPLSRHDGVVSALRAYPPETLLRAARRGLPGFDVSMRDDHALAAFHT